MDKSRELLAASETATMPLFPDGTMPDRPAWYHDTVDPTLQRMLSAAGNDSMALHDAVTGPGGQDFVRDLTHHQRQDDGQAVTDMLNTVARDAVVTYPDDRTAVVLAERAGQSALAVASYIGGHSTELLDMDGTNNSLGQVNPRLTHGLATALELYIPDMLDNGFDNTRGFAQLDTDADVGNSSVPITKGCSR